MSKAVSYLSYILVFQLFASSIYGQATEKPQRFAMGGWIGPEGDRVELFSWNSIPGVESYQWYYGTQPIPGETGSAYSNLTLRAGVTGYYYLGASNSFGETLSSPAGVVMRPPIDLKRDYRILDIPTYGILHTWVGSNTITVVGDGAIFRWGTIVEKILSQTNSIPVLPDNDWAIDFSSVEENGIIDFQISVHLQGRVIVEKGPNGYSILARAGDAIVAAPGVKIGDLGRPIRAGGKVVFFVRGDDMSPDWTGPGYRAIYIWDGATLRTWIDSTNPTFAQAADFLQWNNRELYPPFDGATTAFSTSDNEAVYLLQLNGNLQKIGAAGDPIPGGTDTIRLASPHRVTVSNGRVYFVAASREGAYLLEFEIGREPALRKIAEVGAAVQGGLTLDSIVGKNTTLMSDGSILFMALAGSFHESETGSRYPLLGLFRWRDGVIHEEAIAYDRFAGTQLLFPDLMSAAGTNYIFSAAGGYYTTMQGPPRPANTAIEIQKSAGQLSVSWNNPGWLQTSTNLVDWKTVTATPGTITNTNAFRFYRVWHP